MKNWRFSVNSCKGFIVSLRLTKKNFEDDELPQELFLTRQTTKIRSAFANNMSTYIKLSQSQIFTIMQSGGSFCSWLGHLGKKTLTNIAIPSVRDNLPGLVSNLTSNVINKFKRKISGKGAVRARKRFTLYISNEAMNDIIKIIKSLEDSSVLTDGVTETAKHEIKTKKQISSSFVSTFSRFNSAASNYFSSKKYK